MAEKKNKPSPSKVVCQEFRDQFKYTEKLKNAFLNLTTKQTNALILLEITSCNAAAGYGIPFTAASCETKMYHTELFPFGSIFLPGVELLSNYFCDEKYIPEGFADRVLLSRLLKFLLDTDEISKLKKLDSMPQYAPKESDVAVVLARHFLSKLSSADDYTLDHHCPIRTRTCVCGDCTENIDSYFGDTSIGALNAWHGSLDIVFGNPSLFVTVMEEDGNTSPGGKVPVEVKSVTLDTLRTKSQVLAEVIVFSFIQKKRHSDFDHFLTPCIGITRHQIIFFFYDSANDLLLEGPRQDLMTADGSINYEAVIAAWLVMNYKFYCSGPTSNMLKAPKSNFFKHAKEQLDLYENNLEFRNVCKVSEQFDKTSEKVRRLDTLFVWPEDIEEINPVKKFKTENT